MSANQFKQVKVGVLGLGGFGTLHALTLAGLAEAELVAVVARRQESLDAFNEKLQGVPGWIDLDQAIIQSDAEAWVVASSTASHVEVTTKLLQAGKKVMLEKPIADNLHEAEGLASFVDSDSSNLMLGHILLFNSEFLALRDEVNQRSPLIHVHCQRHRPISTKHVLAGETPFHLTMVHDLYSVLALTGGREPKQFSAQVRRDQNGGIDLAMAQLHYEDGLLAAFMAGFLTPPGMAEDGFDRMEVYGDNWAARLSPNPRPIEVWDDKAIWPMALEIRADPSGPTGMMAEELRCFCRVVRGDQAVPVGATYADAMQVQRWLDQLEKAASC